MKRTISLFVEAYLKQRRKKHGGGPAPRMRAIFVSCCYVGVAVGDHRWHPYYGPAFLRRFWSWYYR